MGGAIALGLALDTDTPVDRLVCIDCFGLGTELPNGVFSFVFSRLPVLNKLAVALFRRSRKFTKASLGGVARDPDALSEDAVDRVWEYARKPSACVAFRNFRKHEITRHGYRTNFTPRLDRLRCPVLFVHGRHDEVVPLAWAERAVTEASNGRLEVLEDCAHWPPRENPDAVVELVGEFCRQASRDAGP
jgi:pimeloyl-ACP methyl ester carboxylesterase